MPRAPEYLSLLQRAALAAWRHDVVELAALAGQPDRSAELLGAGADLSTSRALLLAAAAERLAPHEPLAVLGAVPADLEEGEAPSPLAAVTAEPETPDRVAARAYARQVGELCSLAGYPGALGGFLADATPIRAVRASLQAMQRAATEQVGWFDNRHMCLSPPTGPAPIDAAAIYRARARAMGQNVSGVRS